VLFEIVLRYPDRERIVYSETPLQPGTTVELAGRKWVVLRKLRSGRAGVRARFVCGPSGEAGGAP
jgi:hypothetical protein